MELTDQALELLKNFHSLGEEERQRILELVRALRRAADVLRMDLQLPTTAVTFRA